MTAGNSQTRAKNKYNAKNYDSLRIVVQKGKSEILKAIAEEQGKVLTDIPKRL